MESKALQKKGEREERKRSVSSPRQPPSHGREQDALDRRIDDLLGEVGSGNISSHCDRLTAVLLDLVDDELRLRTVKVGHDDFGSLLSKEERGRLSDTLSGT